MRYINYALINIKNALEHRASIFIWLLTKPLNILVFVIAWTTIYNYSGAKVLGSFTLNQIINYYIFSVIAGTIIWTDVDNKLGDRIQNGNLSQALTKPINYTISSLYMLIGWRCVDFVIQVLPTAVIAALFFGFRQASLSYTAIAIISTGLAFLLNYWFSFTWGLIYFKVKYYHTIHWMKNLLIDFLAGNYVPLTFFPEQLRQLFDYLPFKFLNFVPSTIFVGGYVYSELPLLLITQLFWIIVFYAAATFWFNHSLKNYEGVGV